MLVHNSWDINYYVKQHVAFNGVSGLKDLVDACFVAGTLVTTSRGEVPIELIRPGDLVLTRHGWQPVEWSGETKRANELYAIVLSDDTILIGTPEHRVWTENRGFVQMAQLQGTDLLVTRGDECAKPNTATKLSCFAERCTNDGCRTDGTSCAAAEHCTERNGFIIGGRYPLVGMSITLTATGETIVCRTLSACHRMTMPCGMPLNWHGAVERKNTYSTLLPFDQMRRRGTAALKVWRGTNSTERKLSVSREKRNAPYAIFAKNRFGLRASFARGSTATVHRNAMTVIESPIENGVHMNAFAQVVNTSSWLEKMVASVQKLVRCGSGGTAASVPVYDLTVRDCPEFFANGVLVHNSSGAFNRLVNSNQLAGTLYIRPLRPAGGEQSKLRLLLCSYTQFETMVLTEPHVVIALTNPARLEEDGTTFTQENPTFIPNELRLRQAVLSFADINPEELHDRWAQPHPDYNRPPNDLVLTKEVGKKLWFTLLHKGEGAVPKIIVLVSNGDRRALSVAYGLCDVLRLPRTTVEDFTAPQDAAQEMPKEPPNRHVYNLVRQSREMVVS